MSRELEWYEHFGDRKCLRCNEPLKTTEVGNFCELHASDILMGVGAAYYPTPEDFIKEAEVQGCSKRVGRYISFDIKPGISRCFLVHNTTKLIFGFFYIRGLEIIVKDGLDISAELKRRGVSAVVYSNTENEDERGCGKRKEGGAYVTCYTIDPEDMVKIKNDKKLVKNTIIKGPLLVFKEPVPWEALNFTIRGYVYVNGDRILNREIPEEWRWNKPIAKEEIETKKFKSLESFF